MGVLSSPRSARLPIPAICCLRLDIATSLGLIATSLLYQAQEQRIKELNQLDIELYQYVSHLHDESIEVRREVCMCPFFTARHECQNRLSASSDRHAMHTQ